MILLANLSKRISIINDHTLWSTDKQTVTGSSKNARETGTSVCEHVLNC